MDPFLSADECAILDTVDRFAARHVPSAVVRDRDARHVPPYDLLKPMAEAGLFALAVPEAQGGLGAGWRCVSLVQERLGRHAYMAASLYNRVVGFGLMSLLTYGTESQKQSLVPALIAGDCLIALALTEAGAGSDAGAIATRARPTASGFVINGRKIWISDADGASYLIVAARTDPTATGSRGVTLFLVPRGAAGLSMTLIDKVGNNAMPAYEIGLDDVEVGRDTVLGEVGSGFRHLMATLHYSRASMAATVTGAAAAALAAIIDHATTRHQFGRPIAANQTVAHRLVDLETRIAMSRLMVARLAALIDAGHPCKREAAQAKIVATEVLRDTADAGMQIMASHGYAAGSDIQRFWRDSRLYTFGEGPNEVLRDLIARDMGLDGKGRS